MRTVVARLSAGLFAATVLIVGFAPGATAAEPARTLSTHIPAGTVEFAPHCMGGCIQ